MNVEFLNFNGQTKDAHITKIYDGDSCWATFELSGKVYQWKCRLNGLDTPELRSKDTKVREFAYKVRDALQEKMLNKAVVLECGDFDKYGRILITPFLDGENICEWLISKRFAKPYNGGKKHQWSNEDVEDGDDVEDVEDVEDVKDVEDVEGIEGIVSNLLD